MSNIIRFAAENVSQQGRAKIEQMDLEKAIARELK